MRENIKLIFSECVSETIINQAWSVARSSLGFYYCRHSGEFCCYHQLCPRPRRHHHRSFAIYIQAMRQIHSLLFRSGKGEFYFYIEKKRHFERESKEIKKKNFPSLHRRRRKKIKNLKKNAIAVWNIWMCMTVLVSEFQH